MTIDDMLNDKIIKNTLFKDMFKRGKKAGLHTFE